MDEWEQGEYGLMDRWIRRQWDRRSGTWIDPKSDKSLESDKPSRSDNRENAPHQDHLNSVAMSDDRKFAVFAMIGNALEVWRKSNREWGRIVLRGFAHQGPVHLVSICDEGRGMISA